MIEDFTYDFTYFLDAHKFYLSESSKDIITRFYIFTHQFCDKIDEFNPSNLPCVFKDFLEKDEEVFVNSYSNKIYFKINNYNDKELQNKIKFILEIFGLRIESILDENNLEISYSKYDNTDNGGISETIYTGDC